MVTAGLEYPAQVRACVLWTLLWPEPQGGGGLLLRALQSPPRSPEPGAFVGGGPISGRQWDACGRDQRVRSRGGAREPAAFGRAGVRLPSAGSPWAVWVRAPGDLDGCEWKRDAGWVGVLQSLKGCSG